MQTNTRYDQSALCLFISKSRYYINYMSNSALIDRTILEFLMLSSFAYLFGFVLIKLFYPYGMKDKIKSQLPYVYYRNFIVLSELLLEKQREEYDSKLRDADKIDYSQFKIMTILASAFLQVILIPILFVSTRPYSVIAASIIGALFFISVIWASISSPHRNRYEFAWIHYLRSIDGVYPNLSFSLYQRLYGESTRMIYLLARAYVQNLHKDDINEMFDAILIEKIKLSSFYNKSEHRIANTTKLFRINHLKYDKDVVFGIENERLKKFMNVVFISTIVIFLLLFILSEIITLHQNSSISLLIVFTPMIISVIVVMLYIGIFDNYNLTIHEMTKFLNSQGVVTDSEDPYPPMRLLLNDRLKSHKTSLYQT